MDRIEGFVPNLDDFLDRPRTYHFDDFQSNNFHLRSLQLAVEAEDLDFQHVSVGHRYGQTEEDFSCCLHKQECPVRLFQLSPVDFHGYLEALGKEVPNLELRF